MLVTGTRFWTARAALIYITLGALTEVWSGVWLWYLYGHNPPPPDGIWFLSYGFLLTGLALLVIGLLIRWVSAAGRKSPPVATPADPAVPANVALDVSPRGVAAAGLNQKEASCEQR